MAYMCAHSQACQGSVDSSRVSLPTSVALGCRLLCTAFGACSGRKAAVRIALAGAL